MDYARLRNQTLGSTQDEEAVTVNTRALIDKVLARYSGEWTTLRELIQNAADASASKVTIKFETLPSPSVPTPQSTEPAENIKHVVLNHTVQRLVVTNNGQTFNENDWSRLKRIAEGNPDETKIGAFGVGFYSVFADCESPFVISGKETMAFYWKGNSLFTRKGKVPDDKASNETCFILDYRNTTSTIPSLISICQFLSTSLTFVGIETIELWLDGWNVFSLNKKSSPSEAITIPKGIETKTKEGMMRITGVERQNSQIDATWINIVGWTPANDKGNTMSDADRSVSSGPSLRSFFSKLTGASQTNASAKKAAKEEELAQRAISEDLMGTSRATVFIRVNTVPIKSQVASGFAAELERATKKPPPKTSKIAILTSSYDETSASLSTLTGTASKKAAEIITSILPSKSGRIFIGFPTAQTTGLLAHISAPSLIPTVERESIDLNARYVKTWNTELLNVAGIACRIAYTGEMNVLRDKYSSLVSSTTNGKTISKDEAASSLLPAATHTLKQYTFQESTPLPRAGQTIEEAFWTCNRKASIDIFSSRGVLPSHEVRIASEDLSFVSGIPVIPDPLLKESRPFINKLLDFGLISEIQMSDIRSELERQALTEDQLLEFLKWTAKKLKAGACDLASVEWMFSVTVVNLDPQPDEAEKTQKLLLLGEVKTFINSSRIPPELPTPSHTIPFRFTRGIYHADMQSFGWEELQIVPWLRWLLDGSGAKSLSGDYDLTTQASFAEKVLPVISRNWESLSQSSKTTVTELLIPKTVIPTKLGMKKPQDSYFASVKLFDDLPTITSLNGVKEKFLKSLGVRKTIEISVIFERLMAKSSNKDSETRAAWSHVDLVRYLTNVWSDIPAADIEQLKKTALCPAEKDGDPSQATTRHFKVSELFEPKDDLRSLGLPIIQWPGTWNTYASEAKFLKLLGLRSYPSLPEILKIMMEAHDQGNSKLYEYALKYFIENHYPNNYGSVDLSDINAAFLPLEGDSKSLVPPSECFTHEQSALLQYKILRQDLQQHASKLGVKKNPPIADCAARLISKPPQSRQEARKLFGYFAQRLGEIFPSVAERLGTSPIVPISDQSGSDNEKSRQIRMVAPTSCFLGDGEEYGEIFDYVDFGAQPNAFLLKVGSKHEPTVTEVAQLLLRDYTRILQVIGTERYQALLRKLHLSMSILKRDKLLWKQMKTTPFLLAYKEKIQNTNGSRPSDLVKNGDHELLDEEPEETIREYRLRKADSIVLVDDVVLHNLFRQHLAVAPQEEILEDLYHDLGTPALTSLVDEEARLGPRKGDQKDADRLRDLILERARLFLHDQPPMHLLHDAKWLEKNLEVQTVQSISLRITLRGQNLSHTDQRSASMTRGPNKKAILSITSSFDWWQISTAIVSCVMDRPKPQTTMLFETILTTPLLKLRARGYNVDRILRKKAADEARIAETERRRRKEEEKRKLEEEQKLEELEQTRHADPPSPSPIPVAAAGAQSPKLNIPGGFGDSPEQGKRNSMSPTLPTQPDKSRGIFKSISKHFGFDEQNNWSRNVQNSLDSVRGSGGGSLDQGSSDPPPYTPRDAQGPRGGQVEKVTAPDRLQQNLQSAIRASRAYGSDTLFSMPQTNQIKEVASYCDIRPGHNMTFLGTSGAGLRVYISNEAPNNGSFMAQNAQGLDAFASVLLACANVFGISLQTIHLYYDEKGNTIAFNRDGSLFFNYRFFAQLHQGSMSDALSNAQAIIYWWVVMCHELAHNLVGDHSSDHSYYTEQFVANYFPAIAGAIGGLMSAQR